jgi:hypothetical protein
MKDSAPIPCPKGVLVAGLAPGAYHAAIALVGKGSYADIEWGQQVFQVVDKNLDIPITLARGVDVSAKVVAAEAASGPPLDGMRISMIPELGGPVSESYRGAPDPQGNIRFVNLPPERTG